MNESSIEVWGFNSYRPFRIYWILYEYQLNFIRHKIGSRTGETQTKKYLDMNPKGKIPALRHKNNGVPHGFSFC
jgi:glutathione S-transferase